MVPLKTILENTEKGSNTQLLKSMSFSVFNMCSWNLVHTVMGRSLTGFGPASAADRLLKKKEVHIFDIFILYMSIINIIVFLKTSAGGMFSIKKILREIYT